MKAFLTAAVFLAFFSLTVQVLQLGNASSEKALALKSAVTIQQALADKAYELEAGFKHAVATAVRDGRDVCAVLEEWADENSVNASVGFWAEKWLPARGLSECGEFIEAMNKTATIKCKDNNTHCEWLDASTPGFLLETSVRGLRVSVFVSKGTVIE